MSYQNSPNQSQSFQVVKQGFLQADDLPFSKVLSEEQIRRAFEDEPDSLFGQEDDDVYTPALTLWAFLSQVIQSGAQRSCNAAVERLRTLCLFLGLCVWSACENRRRFHADDPGYGGESGRMAADVQSATGPGLPHSAFRDVVLPGHGCRLRFRRCTLRRQRDGRTGAVASTLLSTPLR